MRHRVSLSAIRATGAFFTSSQLARRVLTPLLRDAPAGAVYCDPTCGAGDLLLTCARFLPLRANLNTTLKAWGRVLIGYDVHPEFVQATKMRLLLLALVRHRSVGTLQARRPARLFPRIRCLDSLGECDNLSHATHLVVNPPFTLTAAPDDCEWASGLVCGAALFLASFVVRSAVGTRVAAILPEVLRTGSRYEKWRGFMQSRADIQYIRPLGQFANWADIDVFGLRLTLRPENKSRRRKWWHSRAGEAKLKRVSDFFSVSVGAVVPHRHERIGKCYAYVTARTLKPWRVAKRIVHRRRFKGPVVSGPFVAVRRTSRPSDRHRAVGAMVTGDRAVAVENHLIVLRPIDGSTERCEQLLGILRQRRTSEWLNRRLRARHLTAAALRELPWWG